MANTYEQTIMIAPTISHAKMPSGMLPPVSTRTASALKNTPEPITIPTTMQMAVGRPYFFSSPFSIVFPHSFTLKWYIVAQHFLLILPDVCAIYKVFS